MLRLPQSPWARYGLALLLVGFSLGLKVLCDPLLGRDAPFLLTFAAIMLSAWYGRLGPGLLATFLCVLGIAFFFVPPYRDLSLDFDKLTKMGLFLGEGLVVCWLTEAFHRSRERAQVLGEAETARQAALQALQQSEQERRKSAGAMRWFKAMSDTANDVCFCADAQDARLTYFNRRAMVDLGFSENELQGLSLRDIHKDFVAEGFQNWVQDLAANKSLGPVEGLFQRKDGSTYPVELSLTLQEFDGCKHLCGVARNITERKQTEENLRLSRQRLDLVVQSTGLGLWFCDLPFNRLIWNDRCKDHFGVPHEAEITIDTFYERLHPDDRDRTRAAIDRSIQTGAPYDIDYRTIALDGRQRRVRAIGRCFVDAQGNPIRFDGVTVDTTERKQTELRLQESERRYAALAELAPLLVWTADPAGNLDFLNQRWLDYTGLPAVALRGWGWTELLHPEDRENTLQVWREALNREEAIETEYRMRDSAGTHQWFLVRAIPLRNEDRIIKWFGACTNIDRQKQGEEALKEADHRKDEFLAMFSHELRNPLAAIRNAMHLFDVQRLGDPTLLEARAVLDRQTQILSGLVDDLLDVFRIRHQKIVLRPETLDLALLARLTLGDLQSALDSVGLAIVAEIPQRPVWVRGDRIRLSQVLMNLLNNAAKFTNAGGRVTVRMAADPDQGRVTVEVRDTGIGIAPGMLAHVFDTFCQASPGLARSRGGLGLGLALVKGLINMHDGEVQAASDGLGQGAEFSFWLPLVTPPLAERFASEETSASRTLRVLIIEDNRDTARTMGLLLRRYGHLVETAHNGMEGVAKALTWKPEIVLCDLGLPEIDGFEVARRLRHDPALGGTRLIAVSGYGQEEDRRRSEQAGFDLHLTKPVDPIDLQRLLTVLKVAIDSGHGERRGVTSFRRR